LIIFDEVHHLPAAGYRNIAEMFASLYRMGLTATFEREDGLHAELNRLVGGKVFEKNVKDLTGTHLSPFRVEKITVELTEEEKEEYEKSSSGGFDSVDEAGELLIVILGSLQLGLDLGQVERFRQLGGCHHVLDIYCGLHTQVYLQTVLYKVRRWACGEP
jgi:superfamily II DNA or RNA helicase